MKKIIYRIFAAILFCGATFFTSCNPKDDNKPIENLAEKIIGKWIYAESNGEPLQTNNKRVFTFVSSTKAFVCASSTVEGAAGTQWNDHQEADVVISGNTVTLTIHTDEHRTDVNKFDIITIDDSMFTAILRVTVVANGNLEGFSERNIRLTKVTADYQQPILGVWEGRCTSDGSAFDDEQVHRWQYKADGTYVYYVKEGDSWVPNSSNTLNEYFVDGNLLCTRWVDSGQEYREWWEITINGDKMNWTALRQDSGGAPRTVTFEMTLVSN